MTTSDPSVTTSSDTSESQAWLAELIDVQIINVHPWLQHLLVACIATLIVLAAYVGLRRLLRAAAATNRAFAQFEPTIARVLRWLYIPVAVLFVLQQAGAPLGDLWTLVSAALAMVAIGFVAVWSVLSNVLSAFMILSTRLFRIGDTIEITEPVAKEGLRGLVIDSNLIYTTLKHEGADGTLRLVKIPNNVFFQKAVAILPRTRSDSEATSASSSTSDSDG